MSSVGPENDQFISTPNQIQPSLPLRHESKKGIKWYLCRNTGLLQPQANHNWLSLTILVRPTLPSSEWINTLLKCRPYIVLRAEILDKSLMYAILPATHFSGKNNTTTDVPDDKRKYTILIFLSVVHYNRRKPLETFRSRGMINPTKSSSSSRLMGTGRPLVIRDTPSFRNRKLNKSKNSWMKHISVMNVSLLPPHSCRCWDYRRCRWSSNVGLWCGISQCVCIKNYDRQVGRWN